VATDEEIDALAAEIAHLHAVHGDLLPTPDVLCITRTRTDALRGLIMREYAQEVMSWPLSSIERVITDVRAQVMYHQAMPDTEGDTWHRDAARSNAAKLDVLRAEQERRKNA